jgi:asparagine synthase (glutamine-hydrolysing)
VCGICGFVVPGGADPRRMVAMADAASHRGPDDEGFFWLERGQARHGNQSVVAKASDVCEVGLGHRRLAIIDLSPGGAQPMSSADGALWVVLNGEVYNYVELREELRQAGAAFHTESDTEVVLAAYRAWGTAAFARLNGMWALAIVDRSTGRLVLCRDRLGIKPLYVCQRPQGLVFASEIKQLLTFPGIAARANPRAVAEYIDTGYEGQPETFFEGICEFSPAAWREYSLADGQPLGVRAPYWDLGGVRIVDGRRDDVASSMRELFFDSVRLQLRSDVPVGVSLSGGLDSSAIFGTVQSLTNGGPATRAFSASYDDPRFDEAFYVGKVVERHGGCRIDVPVRAEDFLRDRDAFIHHHDEPPGSLSQYASWAVMRAASRAGVPVMLSGQGGDELFSGYWPAYYMFLRRALTRPWRLAGHLFGAGLPGGNRELLTQVAPHLRQYLSRRARSNRKVLTPAWQRQTGRREENWARRAQALSPQEYRVAELTSIHLPRLLKWDDRNAMAASVEGRYPFLDHRLVELAIAMPPEVNLSRGWNKILIRQAFADLLPPEVRWRRSKVGFVTPQAAWISGPLRPELTSWAENPSPQLLEIVDREALRRLALMLVSRSDIESSDERQLLLVRLYFLDQWMRVFRVEPPSSAP